MNLKDELIKIVGRDYVLDAAEILEQYSRDHSFYPARRPNFVVRPHNTEEVQEIVKLANRCQVPLIPASSKAHFHGCTIPKQGGIVVDMRRFDRILEIDERNRNVKIEAGVTWGQLQSTLAQHEGMVVGPLMPHPEKSVITTFLEREVPVIQIYEYREPLLSMEVVWPTGDVFRTGSASAKNYPNTLVKGVCPVGPGSVDFYRFLEGAQGTMGIVIWALLKFEYRPRVNRTFFVPLRSPAEAVEPFYRIGRRKIGYECLLLDKTSLISILTREPRFDAGSLDHVLPDWCLILVLSGSRARPEERLAYEEEALRETFKNEFAGLQLLSSLPGVPGIEHKLPDWLRDTWPQGLPFWKHSFKCGCEDLPFISRPERVPGLLEVAAGVAGRYGHKTGDLGIYVQPLENSRACHVDLSFYFNPDSASGMEWTRRVYAEVALALMNSGALYTRPYGVLADLVYGRASSYTLALKKLKSVFDPNHIMAPGNLCF
ncbi:MAG: FAD-binding oxidoreductase [Clostridia bacterium]|nr:MAG: FAD-binding oxidoreductase [Clostridia bacterium]